MEPPRDTARPERRPGPASALARALCRHPLLLFAAFALSSLLLYGPALRGPFVSDDFKDIVNNPYLQAPTLRNVLDILDPWGQARLFTANYAPVHLLAHMLERLVFGRSLLGYHLVNVLVHALVALLLVRLLLASRLAPPAALGGGLFFALHPACVEAVAWISQLKTHGALALALGALLLRTRRPLLAAVLFALGLLTKTSALAALPMAAAFAWVRREGAREWCWLGLWALLFALYAAPQLATFGDVASIRVPAYEDRLVQLRTVAAIGARYLAMAATSYGVSAFQALPPVTSPFDPWWLASVPLGALLAWRVLVSLGRREEEAAYWIGAAAGFGPVSQVFPFLYPIADRYLYFILPGLIGGVLLWAQGALARRDGPVRAGTGLPPAARRALAIALGALLVFFAGHSHQRAGLWRDEKLLSLDAARHYPNGDAALFLRACEAAERGDAEQAVALLRASESTGVRRFDGIDENPCFFSVRDDPRLRAFVRESAGLWLEEARARDIRSQAVLRAMARAHVARNEYGKAGALLREAIALGGPLTRALRTELREIRQRRREG